MQRLLLIYVYLALISFAFPDVHSISGEDESSVEDQRLNLTASEKNAGNSSLIDDFRKYAASIKTWAKDQKFFDWVPSHDTTTDLKVHTTEGHAVDESYGDEDMKVAAQQPAKSEDGAKENVSTENDNTPRKPLEANGKIVVKRLDTRIPKEVALGASIQSIMDNSDIATLENQLLVGKTAKLLARAQELEQLLHAQARIVDSRIEVEDPAISSVSENLKPNPTFYFPVQTTTTTRPSTEIVTNPTAGTNTPFSPQTDFYTVVGTLPLTTSTLKPPAAPNDGHFHPFSRIIPPASPHHPRHWEDDAANSSPVLGSLPNELTDMKMMVWNGSSLIF